MVTENETPWESIEIGVRKKTPLVTFTLSNTLRFNKALIEEYGLEKIKSVKILFNVGESKIRIGFLFYEEEPVDNSLKLSWLDGSGAFISAYSIMAKLGINNNDLRHGNITRRFIPYIEDYDSERKIVVIDFKNKENLNEDDKNEKK